MAINVLVAVEVRDGELKKSGREGLGLARQLVEQAGGGEVSAVLAVDSAGGLPQELAAAGADRILVAENPDFANYCPGGHAAAVAAAAGAVSADAVIIPASALGKDLVPRVSARLDAPAASDCIDASCEGGKLTATRPACGGKVQVTVSFAAAPAILCIRTNVFETLPAENSRSAAVEKLAVELGEAELRLKITGVEHTSGERPDVSEADVVISGGRGMQEGENFKLLEQLAASLGAGIGASRAAVDAGWRTHGDQVGQTGKFVSPSLYVACGISGAVQHLAGMLGAKVIVAINKDADAPIFKVANYGIVGDVFEVLPALNEELSKQS
ncbi:MAG: electron transfer flavoprotein subunit alpha/FixB family protein [Candidatus Glassbacteria bacterium]|nr:electron transfer flavoprotein subunit alpha/FixB family protein [Candidatus Glassbacteria bacterium]